MIGTERMLLGEQPRRSPTSGDAPHVRNDIGKFNEQWIARYRDRARRGDARRVPARHRPPARRAARAARGRSGTRKGFTPEGPGPYRQFMAIRVFDCWYHDQDIREALDRPGFLEGDGRRPLARPHPAQGAAATSSARRPARRRARRWCSTSPATRRSSPRSASTGAPRCSPTTPADPTTRLTLDRRTFARLAGGRWTGDDARADGSGAGRGRRRARRARRRQPRVHALTALDVNRLG